MENEMKYVVVATVLRGVFAGELEEYNRETKTAILQNARQCVYWSKETKGFIGLSSIGPQDGSRVSPPSPRVELPGIHCVSECSPEARKSWESNRWS